MEPDRTQSLAAFLLVTGTKTARAIVEWLSHCIVVAALLAGMKGLEMLITSLWGGEDIRPLGLMSLHNLVKLADVFLLAAVLILGGWCVVKAYKGPTR
jgi:hypothetical protein